MRNILIAYTYSVHTDTANVINITSTEDVTEEDSVKINKEYLNDFEVSKTQKLSKFYKENGPDCVQNIFVKAIGFSILEQ